MALQERPDVGRLLFVQSRSVQGVLNDFGLERRGALRLSVKAIFCFLSPKKGVYAVGRYADMLQDCIIGREKLFPVQVTAGFSDYDTMEALRKLPYIDSTVPWRGQYRGFFPDTYYVRWGTKMQVVLDLAQKTMDRVVREMFAKKNVNLENFTFLQIVVLASIIERETNLSSEYARIAKVYLRRLGPQLTGRLYSDPPIHYAMEKRLKRKWPRKKLYYKDLMIVSPYNTYRNAGLPPGPISNPSAKVLRALADLDDIPREGECYFFWSAREKRSIFSLNLREHARRKAILA